MPTRGRPTMNVRLEPWQLTALKILAKREGCTVSDLIRESVDTILTVNNLTPETVHNVATNDENA